MAEQLLVEPLKTDDVADLFALLTGLGVKPDAPNGRPAQDVLRGLARQCQVVMKRVQARRKADLHADAGQPAVQRLASLEARAESSRRRQTRKGIR